MQFFFVSGYNKSGTTFIQMLLDAHPAINCPSEQHFKTLWQGLEPLARNYKNALEFFDERTARQGIRFDETEFSEHLFTQALLKLAAFGADADTTHAGLNDNSLIDKAGHYARLLPEARFIFIIRDPRDVGVSLWHHRMRVEPGFAEKNQPLDEMILGCCRAWPVHLGKITDLQADIPGRVHIVRYEDLIGKDRDTALSKILDFMDAAHDSSTIATMFEATDFDKLKKKEDAAKKNKQQEDGFFRSGKRNGWRDILDDAQKARALEICGDTLENFGYTL